MNEEVNLPPFPADAEGNDLGWHALNYRTAHTVHAQAMWEELKKYVHEYARTAVLAERERCAEAVLAALSHSGVMSAEEIAAAIRGNG